MPIPFGNWGMNNLAEGGLIDLPEKRGIFTAGMHFAVGQQGHKVECRAAAKSGTSRKRLLGEAKHIEEVILNSQHRIHPPGTHIIPQEIDKFRFCQ